MKTQVLSYNYNREHIKPGILHIGVGNFHRAHEEFYTNLLLEDGNVDLVKKLIKYKPNWNFKNNQKKSPLSIVVDKSYLDLLKLLMASNYEIELINK